MDYDSGQGQYTTDSRQTRFFMLDVLLVSISPLMTLTCVLFVLFCCTYLVQELMKSKDGDIVCYDILGPAFFGRQPGT